MPTCTCGKTKPHAMGERQTSDGATVILWSEGSVTGRLGVGVYARAPRARRDEARAIAAGWLMLGEVELYDARDVRALVVMARRAVVQRNFPPLEYLRRAMAGERFHSDGRVIRSHTARCQCPACLRRRMTSGQGLESR